MKVKELIEELQKYDGEEEVIFGIDNLNSGKRYDMQTELVYIGYKYNIVFCDREREYPRYKGGDGVYIKFKYPGDIDIREEDYIIY